MLLLDDALHDATREPPASEVDAFGNVACSGTPYNTHGRGPAVIVINLSRAIDKAKLAYDLLESLNDGIFISTKYQYQTINVASPHIVVMATWQPTRSASRPTTGLCSTPTT